MLGQRWVRANCANGMKFGNCATLCRLRIVDQSDHISSLIEKILGQGWVGAKCMVGAKVC